MPSATDYFAQNFQQSFGQGRQMQFAKKQAEEEFLRRQDLMKLQSSLQDQSLTPEEKMLRLYQSNPQGFQQFRSVLADPAGLQSRQLDQAQTGLGIQQYNAATNRMNSTMTPQIRNYQFLKTLDPNSQGMDQQAAAVFGNTQNQDSRIQQYNYFMGQNLGMFRQKNGREPTPEELAAMNQELQDIILRNPMF